MLNSLEIPKVQHTKILRYAFGMAISLIWAVSLEGKMGYLLPLLVIPFLASNKALSLGMGIGFILVVAASVLIANFVVLFFIDYPAVLLIMVFLAIFYIFYINSPYIVPAVRSFLLVSILIIPNLATNSVALAQAISLEIALTAIQSVVLVWLIYYLFPVKEEATATVEAGTTDQKELIASEYQAALMKTVVLMPVVLLFYLFEITSAILILVYVATLTLQKGFGKGFKEGWHLIISNVIGGLLTIPMYELLTVVPNLVFFFLLLMLTGIGVASKLYGTSKMAPLYGMAITPFILIIGITTSGGDMDAGTKMWTRVMQITMAVVYVAISFGLIEKWRVESAEV